MKKVYIAGAISANNLEGGLRNLRQGILMGAELLKMGFAPFVPHLDFQYCLVQDERIPVETFYNYDLEWLKVCDYILVLPNSENSKGVKKEIETAEMLGMPIFTNINDLLECTCNGYNQIKKNEVFQRMCFEAGKEIAKEIDAVRVKSHLRSDNINDFVVKGTDLFKEQR